LVLYITYILIVNHRIEYDIESTYEQLVSESNITNKNQIKANIIGVWLSDSWQVVFVKMSSTLTDFLKVHPIGSIYKILQK
jgi:hypothetical protein